MDSGSDCESEHKKGHKEDVSVSGKVNKVNRINQFWHSGHFSNIFSLTCRVGGHLIVQAMTMYSRKLEQWRYDSFKSLFTLIDTEFLSVVKCIWIRSMCTTEIVAKRKEKNKTST
ncbi:CLUMA_CG001493, isoform A [Clunio marinus]|uniref:CLUMA_CG001493, isoform A n=1 Tax=Clunio marinus TaxID=568069 RepID=A0A1J1HI39_9DIPT|nr:CLUMA_CG001493, isoform A [Clunio marinus]